MGAATDNTLARRGLNQMVRVHRESLGIDFQISVDTAKGITSGISAADRARTIAMIASPTSTATDHGRPGHIFTLRAKPSGVVQRAGHTEAAVDLARLAGARPSGVICEGKNDNGTMSRLPGLKTSARRRGLKICPIADLIKFHPTREKQVERIEVEKRPTDFSEFDLFRYRSKLDGQDQVALVQDRVAGQNHVLVPVLSECLTGDVFDSRRRDCGPQLQPAMQQIADDGCGVILYMRQEGRGIGLASKLQADKLQEQGRDTVEANHPRGYAMDLREYGVGAQILAASA